MDDRAATVLLDLMTFHREDLFAAADGDAFAVKRIALTSYYSRDDVEAAAGLLRRQQSLLAQREPVLIRIRRPKGKFGRWVIDAYRDGYAFSMAGKTLPELIETWRYASARGLKWPQISNAVSR